MIKQFKQYFKILWCNIFPEYITELKEDDNFYSKLIKSYPYAVKYIPNNLLSDKNKKLAIYLNNDVVYYLSEISEDVMNFYLNLIKKEDVIFGDIDANESSFVTFKYLSLMYTDNEGNFTVDILTPVKRILKKNWKSEFKIKIKGDDVLFFASLTNEQRLEIKKRGVKYLPDKYPEYFN